MKGLIHFGGVALVTILLFVSIQSKAQETVAPRLIQFSGVLKSITGQPISGVEGVTFSLYGDREEGAPLWQETQNVNSDEQGHFAVLLGAASGSGMPVALFASGGSRWLGFRVNLPEQPEQPRVLLVSVPYALTASNADTLGGLPPSAFMLRPESIGDRKSTGTGEVSAQTLAPTVAVFGASAGDAGYLGKFVNSTDLVDSVVFQNGLNVGIGTTSPGQKLQVQDSATNTYPLALQQQRGSVDGDFVGLGFVGTDNVVLGNLRNQRSDTTGTFDLIFQGTRFGFPPVDTMILKGNGNVGIGAKGPTSRLQVQDSITNTYPLSVQHARNMLNGDFTGLTFATSDNVPVGGVKNIRNDTSFSFDTVLQATPFGGGVTDILTAKGNGSVGVGVTNPTEMFEVAGRLKGSQVVTTASTGTPPFVISSTTQVPNLNASLVGGLPASSLITAVTPGTGLAGNTVAGNATLSLSPAAQTRGITYLAGCDTCSVLADTDSQATIYYNVVGAMTFQSVVCFADAGAPVINVQRVVGNGAPANILNSNLTCNGTPVNTPGGFSISTLGLTDKLNFLMVSAGGAKRITLAIQTTVN